MYLEQDQGHTDVDDDSKGDNQGSFPPRSMSFHGEGRSLNKCLRSLRILQKWE